MCKSYPAIPAYLLKTVGVSIYDQLRFEECFFRTTADCLIWINQGSPDAVVLGVSSCKEQLIHLHLVDALNIPLIRRYSGGGTVVVDSDTIFVTFIFNAKALNIEPFPSQIMEWSALIYRALLEKTGFKLRENDYVIDNKKFGGNAQYLSKDRFVHHSSLLFDYAIEKMNVLKLPQKIPNYRQNRPHEAFLTKLANYFDSKQQFVSDLEDQLKKIFDLKEVSLEEFEKTLNPVFRQSTQLI